MHGPTTDPRELGFMYLDRTVTKGHQANGPLGTRSTRSQGRRGARLPVKMDFFDFKSGMADRSQVTFERWVPGRNGNQEEWAP